MCTVDSNDVSCDYFDQHLCWHQNMAQWMMFNGATVCRHCVVVTRQSLIIQSLLDVNISSVRSVTHLQSGLHTSHSTCELLGCNNRSMLVTAAVYMVGSLDL